MIELDGVVMRKKEHIDRKRRTSPELMEEVEDHDRA